jgi:hypothetical protein
MPEGPSSVHHLGDEEFDPPQIRKKGKAIILINNGITPANPKGH